MVGNGTGAQMYPKLDFGSVIFYSTVFNILKDMCCFGV